MHPTQKLQNASATQFCIKVHFLNHHITTLHIMFGIILLLILFVTFLCQISFLCIEYPNLGSSQHSRHNSSAINCDWVYSEWAPNWLNFPMQFSKTGPVGALLVHWCNDMHCQSSDWRAQGAFSNLCIFTLWILCSHYAFINASCLQYLDR